jgi:hypothetical protein
MFQPEQLAREKIDALLQVADWTVQNADQLNSNRSRRALARVEESAGEGVEPVEPLTTEPDGWPVG